MPTFIPKESAKQSCHPTQSLWSLFMSADPKKMASSPITYGHYSKVLLVHQKSWYLIQSLDVSHADVWPTTKANNSSTNISTAQGISSKVLSGKIFQKV